MKFSAIITLVACLALARFVRAADAVSWQTAEEISARIKAPTFPHRDFALTDFGAVAVEKPTAPSGSPTARSPGSIPPSWSNTPAASNSST